MEVVVKISEFERLGYQGQYMALLDYAVTTQVGSKALRLVSQRALWDFIRVKPYIGLIIQEYASFATLF